MLGPLFMINEAALVAGELFLACLIFALLCALLQFVWRWTKYFYPEWLDRLLRLIPRALDEHAD